MTDGAYNVMKNRVAQAPVIFGTGNTATATAYAPALMKEMRIGLASFAPNPVKYG
jgi:hypothetical protein